MSDLQKRVVGFLVGCMGARLALVYLAYKYPQKLAVPFTAAAVALSIGFMLIYVFGLRKTGPEVFGDTIWWDSLRPFHSILWGLFAFQISNGNPDSYLIILMDTLLGFLAWSLHHGNF